MSFEKHARTVSLFTLVSRFSGLARDAAQSRVFGVGPIMDAFAIAFQLPNLFRRLFGDGALSASFTPVYAKLEQDNPQKAKLFASVTLALLAVVLAALTLVGEAVVVSLPLFLPKEQLAYQLMATMLPYMPLICVVALMGSILNVHGKFAVAAASPIILNAAIIAASIGVSYMHGGLERELHIQIVAYSVVVAGLLQLAWMMWSMRGYGIRLSLQWHGCRDSLRTMLTTMLPMMLGLGVFQINTFIDSMIASYPTLIGPTIFGMQFPLMEGSNAAMNFATRLYEFPLGVFGIAIATAIFPTLSRQASNPALFAHTLRRGIRLALFIGLPASAGLIVVRTHLTAVIFQGGKFSADDTIRVATILLGFAPAVAVFSIMQTMTRAFYALGDTATPTRVSIWMVCLNFILNCTLIWTPLNTAGLAWSTTICAFIQAAILMYLLHGRVNNLFDIHTRMASVKIFAATLVMTAIITAIALALPSGMQAIAHVLPVGTGWGQSLVQLLALTCAGIVCIFALAKWWNMPEWKWTFGQIDEDIQAIDKGP
ncbi:MAG: murein biosynthesis integral membrane protein MurJ [Phycisphaerales bacterium]|nr:murein biosynthesis integral membrane protein MurJ [Phycisphaerales bacterium]